MDKKYIIIIGLLILIAILGYCIAITLTPNVTYERIEIVPNATSIEIPTNNASYIGEINDTGVKQWTFKQGTLMTFNSEESINARGLYGLAGAVGIKDINDMIINHFEKKETIDGFAVYTLDGETLDIHGKDKIYCIMTGNDTTHDNIIIATDNKDVALHMAKSIKYKINNSTSNAGNNVTYAESTNTASSSNSQIQNRSDDEALYGGLSKEEYIYRQGLADGHKQAEEALSNDESVPGGIDAIGTSDDSSSSSIETTTDSDSSSNVETVDSGDTGENTM